MKDKFLRILGSFLAAFALFIYVVSVVSPDFEQSYSNIPVNFENESVLMDRDLLLVSGQNSTVSVRLKGDRSELNRLSASSIMVTVDLSGISEPGHYEREYRVTVPSGYSSVSLYKRITASVSVDIVEYARKEVPVQLVLYGEQAEGLMIDREAVTFSTNSVMVSGPKAEVDQVSIAGIEIDRTNLTETLSDSFVYTLMNEAGEPVDVHNVVTDTGEIHVMLPVEHIKEIPLTVNLLAGGGAALENAVVVVEPQSVTISGSQEALDKITEFVVTTVDLANVDTKNGISEVVELRLPENVTNRSNVSEAAVTVSLSGLSTKTVTVFRDNIRVLHIPDGMDVNIYTQQIDITLRGPAAQLAGLAGDDLSVTVDVSNQTYGPTTLGANVTVEGSEHVGAFGKYTVTLSLVPHVEPTEPEE